MGHMGHGLINCNERISFFNTSRAFCVTEIEQCCISSGFSFNYCVVNILFFYCFNKVRGCVVNQVNQLVYSARQFRLPVVDDVVR